MTVTNMNYTALLPEVVILAASVITLLAGSYLPRNRQILTRWFSLGALIVSAGTALIVLGQPSTEIFSGTYAIDAPTTVIRIIAPVSAAIVIVLGREEFVGSARESETYALLLLATLGTVVVAGATDLLVLMAGYLLASIPLYALIGLSRTARAAEATLKTYLMGALFGVLLLAGLTLLTGLSGTSSYTGMTGALAHAPAPAVAAGIVGVIIGLLFKAGGVPGHFWVPDAAEASGISVAAFLTTVPKLGALVALARLVMIMPTTIDVPLLVAVLAALSMSVGNLAALAQSNVRRLLGWSTVSQVGYLLMPVAVISLAKGATTALLAYLVFYAITNLTIFAVVACFPGRDTLAHWAGIAKSHPWLTGTIIIGALSLVGTPPTAVFFGKLAVFTAAWDGGQGWLVVVAAANTVLSLVYYLRLFVSPFQRPNAGAPEISRSTVPRTVRATALTLGATTLLLGLVTAAFGAIGSL
jgi:NADH-quinone oxidoreductase subunit N